MEGTFDEQCVDAPAVQIALAVSSHRAYCKGILPLVRMDPDVHARFGIAVMFSMLSIFSMTATFPAASMALENAAGSR